MRINKISVTKLFGVFNHQVYFNMEDRITLVHGQNGIGKTALLRIINGFFNSRYSELRSLPFEQFRVDFDDGSHLLIAKFIELTESLIFQFLQPDSKPETFSLNFLLDSKLSVLDSAIRKLRLSNEKMLKDIDIFQKNQSLENIDDSFDDLLDEDLERIKEEPKWLSQIKKSIDVRFIETQRLLTHSDVPKAQGDMKHPSMIPSLDIYSQELAEEIQTKLAEYGALSQSLDRTFPARVVNNKITSELTEETLRNKLNEIEEQRSRLIKTSLLEGDENSDFQLQQHIDLTTKNILSVYLEDVEKKFMVFNEIAAKIELFQRIIQQKFRYKNMNISKKNGFTFTTADGKPLSPTDLSFGEQHELVMLYQLLFKVKPSSLILIDEPELSLHVAWQVEFLKDLQAIIKLADFDVLIATHSPSIIDDRWDLTVELKGPVE
ncbi:MULTISPECIES: AAA family ATPase [unclassified Microcoleus]|uniref:AAA family ATPase n=1 Tax=unclassified Microcoleus TaxID=2642155 RepID=UPI002FD40A64